MNSSSARLVFTLFKIHLQILISRDSAAVLYLPCSSLLKNVYLRNWVGNLDLALQNQILHGHMTFNGPV